MLQQFLLFPDNYTARATAQQLSAHLPNPEIKSIPDHQNWIQLSWSGRDIVTVIVALANKPKLIDLLHDEWPVLVSIEELNSKWEKNPTGMPLSRISGPQKKKGDGFTSILESLDSHQDLHLLSEDDARWSSIRSTNGMKAVRDALRNNAATVPVPRELEGRFPANIRIAQSVALEVRIREKSDLIRDNAVTLRDFALPAEGGEVKLALHAPNFEAVDGGALIQTVLVPQRGDSDPVVFELKATRLGKQNLEVTAYFGGDYLGKLAMEVHVNERATGQSEIWTQPTQIGAGDKGDITLQIRQLADCYEFQVFGGWPMQPLRSELFARTPADEIEALLSSLNAQAGGTNDFSTAALTRQWLAKQGARLWDAFIPQQLQDFLWENADDLRRLTVISDGDAVPWELLYPSGPKNTDKTFLTERLQFARWTYGKNPPPSRLKWGATTFVQPESNLQLAAKEVKDLAQIIPGAKNVEPTQDLTTLLERLNSDDLKVLHFACHNQFNAQSAANSYIEMNNGEPFDTSWLANEPAWKEAGPLVFLNVCRGAGQGMSYTKTAGWASAFLARGAGAFLSSLWEVRDESSPDFAAAFYAGLRAGNTCAQALTQARNAISQRPGDPTWLAYAFYGDPDATFEPTEENQ